jgi:anti-anti-sigma factor
MTSATCGNCVCMAGPNPEALYIEVSGTSRIPVLHLDGEITVYTLPTLHARIKAAIEHGAWSIVADLEEVAFLDAEGLGAFIRARRLTQTNGGTVVLAAVPAQGQKSLEVKGLELLLPCFPTVADAVALLESWSEAPCV